MRVNQIELILHRDREGEGGRGIGREREMEKKIEKRNQADIMTVYINWIK